jgi:hypothetical protein
MASKLDAQLFCLRFLLIQILKFIDLMKGVMSKLETAWCRQARRCGSYRGFSKSLNPERSFTHLYRCNW